MKIAMPVWLLVVLLASPLSATEIATAMPPQGVYRDSDNAANALVKPPGMRSQFRQAVNAAIQKNPKNATALAHRAYLFLDSGDVVRARRDFDAAIAAAEPGSDMERHVLWSRGWAAYDLADYQAALADWQESASLHGGQPFWVPYTYALLYWTIGQHEAALAWYQTAVDSNEEWGNEAGFAKRTRHWKAPQREAMRALFDAWQQRAGNRAAAG